MILFLVSSLLIPKIFLYQLQKRGRYEKWVVSVFTSASSTRDALAKIIKVPFWVMLEGAMNNSLWAGMFTYVVFLIIFPWFSGQILSDDYPLGHMSLRGWTVKPFKADPGKTVSGLGIPDIMGVVLPYVYGVVLPLLLMLSALSAEKVACEFHITSLAKWQKKADRESESRPQSHVASKTDASPDNESSLSKGEVAGFVKEEVQAHEESEAPISEKRETKHDHCRLCERLVRKGLFVGCLGVAYNHWRVCSPYFNFYLFSLFLCACHVCIISHAQPRSCSFSVCNEIPTSLFVVQLCSTMLGAYGPMVLVAGPAYAWGVPALLIFTLFQTSKIRSKLPRHEY